MGNCVSSVFDFIQSSFLSMGNSSTSIPPRHHQAPENAFDGIAAQASPSSTTFKKKGPCDVFINHRGCDVKHKLASTIYHTLDLVGIHAFLDVENLELGDSIPQEIHEAMCTAGLHIAIFSKRYAESPWCLAELSFMVKSGTTILPVFYHVKPDDLRWVAQGKGLYASSFLQHEKKGRYSSSMLKEWKSALQKVSYLSGYMLNSDNDDEGKLLKSIVNSVLGTIKKVPLEVAKHPVGMDEIVEDFERSGGKSIQGEEHVQIMGIVGFGGSGKTTLATELYNRKSSSFNRSSFLHDVRDAAQKNALHTKQKKLLEDLLIKNHKSFDNFKEGKGIVADRLKALCVLIVLDDVDHEDQLDALLSAKESLGSGSLVIVTTREGRVLTKCGITSVYAMKPLRHFNAKQLFCWHAFLLPFPQEGFEELVEFFLEVCSGLPLSLKVIGGQLYGRKSVEYWYAQLDKIRRILPEDIKTILKVSFDALERDDQKVFLDIACFFIGEERRLAISVWDGSGWSGLCSLETLLNKCLVEVDMEGLIRMHDHLRDLGRDIATTSPPSRFWFERQSMHIQRGMPIRGIIAATAGIIHCNRPDSPPPFKEYIEMVRISNLRIGLQLLVVGGNHFTEECGELSRGLLWLRWFDCEHRNIPSWLSLENIRVLQILKAFNLETLWDDAHPPLELRELLIKKAFDFQSFPRSIGHLKHLKRLSLDCDLFGSELQNLPEEFCQLHSLEHLALTCCRELSSLPNQFGDLVNLRYINLRGCRSLEMLPVSFKQLIHLEYLNLSSCEKLTLESDILENITNLKVLDVSWCHKLQVLPHNVTSQASLGELHLRDTSSLRELPASIDQLSKLKMLIIVGCPFLTRLPISLGKLSNLTTLMLERCPELSELPSLAGLVSLNNLHVKDCDKIKKIEGLEHLTSLKKLLVLTSWTVPGIHALGGTEGLWMLDLTADNISAFEACIQSIQIGNWPWRITICARIFPGVQSILDSFTFPGLVGDNSLKTDYIELHVKQYRLKCWETNQSNAAIVCFLVRSSLDGRSLALHEGQNTVEQSRFHINHKQATRVHLGEGEWIVMSVFGKVSPLIEDGRRFLQTSIVISRLILGDDGEIYDSLLYEDIVFGGRLIVGERGSIAQGFKQLFQILCKASTS